LEGQGQGGGEKEERNRHVWLCGKNEVWEKREKKGLEGKKHKIIIEIGQVPGKKKTGVPMKKGPVGKFLSTPRLTGREKRKGHAHAKEGNKGEWGGGTLLNKRNGPQRGLTGSYH